MLTEAATYDELYRNFRWEIPARFNIATACCDRHADGTNRLALIYIDEDGTATRTSFDEVADMSRRSSLAMPALLKSTLVVGMAMGMTSYEPVVNLRRLAQLYDKYEVDSRANFIYLALPGSLLDQFASSRGYQKAELQPDRRNSTAGRHSSPLTRGSLYALGLSGADLNAWMAGTVLDKTDSYAADRASQPAKLFENVLGQVRTATKRAGGVTRNHGGSAGRRLGVKKFTGEAPI